MASPKKKAAATQRKQREFKVLLNKRRNDDEDSVTVKAESMIVTDRGVLQMFGPSRGMYMQGAYTAMFPHGSWQYVVEVEPQN